MSTHVLQTRLSELRAAIRRYLALEGLAAVLLALLAAIATTLALDWTLRLTQGQRALINGLSLAGVAVVAWRRLARPLTRALPDEEMALVLERRFPELEDRVITTVQLAGRATDLPTSEQLLAAVVEQADEAAQKISPAETLDRERLKRWVAAGFAALAAVAVAWTVFPTTMSIWFQRDMLLRDVPWPQGTYLTVADFGDKPMRVMRGGALDIVVQASGKKIPETVRLEMAFASSGRFREELSATGAGKFSRRLDGVVEPFRFWVSGGDATTPTYAVELVEPPVLSDVRFRAIYPEYTGLGSKMFGLGEGNLEVPVGTMLELSAVSSKALKGGKVFYGDRESGAVMLAEKNRLTTRLKVDKSARLRLALDDAEGFTSDAAFTYPVFALPDRPPVLRLAVTGVSDKVTKVATVPLSVEARDDYGVTAMDLRFSKKDLATGESRTMPLPAQLPSRWARFDHIWPIEPVGMTEGESLLFRVEARDAAIIPAGGNRAESTAFALRIVSAAELLEELMRRQKAFRIEFERMTNHQREIVDKTKLLRDTVAAGQSLSPFATGAGSPATIVADERDIGNGTRNLGEQFARVLTEMRNNRVSTEGDYQRLEFRIIGPLGEVSQELLNGAAAEMERVNVADPPGALQPRLEAQVEEQTRIHEKMVVVLADMMKGETLADAVALLRDILANQQNLSDAAKKRLEEEIKRLLGGGNQ